MKNNILKYSFFNAFCAIAYIGLIALLMDNAENIFGQLPKILGTMSFLLLFVISAAVMGLLIFGRPILWYWDGKKQEAVALISYTIIVLALIAVVTVAFLSFIA